jgi:GT2 family glycosyltransferase
MTGNMKQQTIAVAIPTYGRDEVLIDTIRNVLAQARRPDEIIVVDQTELHEDHVERCLRDFHYQKQIRWIKHSPPNLPGARNRAVNEARSDLIIFIDDDVVLPKDYVLRHLRSHDRTKYAAIVGPVVENQKLIDSWGLDWTGKELVGNTRELRGGNFSIKRDVFIACGGFDEGFVRSANYEENDFARRLLKYGYLIGFNEQVRLLHLKAPVGGCRIPGNRSAPEWTKSYCYLLFCFRHAVGIREIIRLLQEALRGGPLRKENVFSPSRWILAWGSFLFAISRALLNARRGVLSPFTAVHPVTQGVSHDAPKSQVH